MSIISYNPVIHTRVQVSRNLNNHKFPLTMNQEEKNTVLEEVVVPIVENPVWGGRLDALLLETIDDYEAQALVEKYIITKKMLTNKPGRGILYKKDKSVSVMINDEDHLCIQSLKKGLNLSGAYDEVKELDEMFAHQLTYAVDEQYGYKTACLTKVGTGMKLSILLHLPGTIRTGELNNMIQFLSGMGIAVQGTYGEGTDTIGNRVMLTNSKTTIDEDAIFKLMKDAVMLVIEKENMYRTQLIKQDQMVIADRIHRAFGILRNARLISYREAMQYFSDITFGIDMSLIQGMSRQKVETICQSVLPSSIQKNNEKKLNGRETDFKRAELIRNALV